MTPGCSLAEERGVSRKSPGVLPPPLWGAAGCESHLPADSSLLPAAACRAARGAGPSAPGSSRLSGRELPAMQLPPPETPRGPSCLLSAAPSGCELRGPADSLPNLPLCTAKGIPWLLAGAAGGRPPSTADNLGPRCWAGKCRYPDPPPPREGRDPTRPLL